jgi:hypothetical protein
MASNYYVDAQELKEQAVIYKTTAQYTSAGKYIYGSANVTEQFGEQIYKISRNLSNKTNFNQYTYKEDFIMEGLHNTIKYFHNYKPEKGTVFNYITMICYNAFVAYIEKQKRHSVIKDVCYQKKELFIRDEEESYAQKSIDYTVMKDPVEKKPKKKPE